MIKFTENTRCILSSIRDQPINFQKSEWELRTWNRLLQLFVKSLPLTLILYMEMAIPIGRRLIDTDQESNIRNKLDNVNKRSEVT